MERETWDGGEMYLGREAEVLPWPSRSLQCEERQDQRGTMTLERCDGAAQEAVSTLRRVGHSVGVGAFREAARRFHS